MEKDHYIGLIIILAIIGIALFGGAKKGQNVAKFTNTTGRVGTIQTSGSSGTRDTKPTNPSSYTGQLKIEYVSNSRDADSEYVVLSSPSDAKKVISITGWVLKSASGQTVSIPKGNLLYFTGSLSQENDDVLVYPGDRIYIITGRSSINQSFRTNKCSGYLNQFQSFTPTLSTNCPLARNEDLSSIPKRIENDDCFDMIDRYPTCHTQTESLPRTLSYECTKFITEKLNYNSCVNTHKGDVDFYEKEWHVYLKRGTEFWTNSRYETATLLDTDGKVVDVYKF